MTVRFIKQTTKLVIHNVAFFLRSNENERNGRIVETKERERERDGSITIKTPTHYFMTSERRCSSASTTTHTGTLITLVPRALVIIIKRNKSAGILQD